MKFNFQRYLIKLFDNPLGRWYLGVPKGKHIYKITPTGCHYYTGEISKRNRLPIICTGDRSPGQRDIIRQKIMKLAGIVSIFVFLPLFPKSLLPLIALTDTGYKSPNANQAVPGAEHLQWTNPANVYSSDDTYATTSQNVQAFNQYKGYAFGIPMGATIDGLEATVEVKVSAVGGTCFVQIRSRDNTNTQRDKICYPTTTETVYTLGGSTNLWDGTWDEDWLNGYETNFRHDLRGYNTGGTISVDHIQFKVYYTAKLNPAFLLNMIT